VSKSTYTHQGKAAAAQQGHGAVALALLLIVLCSEGKLGIQCSIMAALRGHRKLGPYMQLLLFSSIILHQSEFTQNVEL